MKTATYSFGVGRCGVWGGLLCHGCARGWGGKGGGGGGGGSMQVCVGLIPLILVACSEGSVTTKKKATRKGRRRC